MSKKTVSEKLERKLSVLLLEDSKEDAKFIKDKLEKEVGCSVSVVENTQSVLDKLKESENENPYKILILDYLIDNSILSVVDLCNNPEFKKLRNELGFILVGFSVLADKVKQQTYSDKINFVEFKNNFDLISQKGWDDKILIGYIKDKFTPNVLLFEDKGDEYKYIFNFLDERSEKGISNCRIHRVAEPRLILDELKKFDKNTSIVILDILLDDVSTQNTIELCKDPQFEKLKERIGFFLVGYSAIANKLKDPNIDNLEFVNFRDSFDYLFQKGFEESDLKKRIEKILSKEGISNE